MDLPLAFYVAGLIIVLLLLYFFFGSFLHGAGYQPTPPDVADRMLELGAVAPRERVYDLGAGTGALLFLSAEKGASVVGYEIEPIRYLVLRLRRWRHPQGRSVTLRRGNFFDADLRPATVVLTFLWPGAMARLKEKFERELVPGTRVVSYWHPIPGWTPQEVDRRLRVYLYIR